MHAVATGQHRQSASTAEWDAEAASAATAASAST